MTNYISSLEGYPDGGAVTLATVGTDTPWAEVAYNGIGTTGGGTISAVSTNATKGTRCMLLAPDQAQTTLRTVVYWYPNNAKIAFSMYFMLTGSPSTTGHFLRISAATASALQAVVAFSANRNILVYDMVGGTPKYTSTSTCAVNTWYRLEGQIQNGTGTTDTFAIQLFQGNSTISVWSQNITGNFGTLPFNRFGIGKHGTWVCPNIYLDDIQVVDGSTAPIGPTAGGTGLPTLTMPADDTIQVNSGTHSYTCAVTPATGGAISAYRWTQKSGPAVTLVNANSATVSFAAPAAAGDIGLHCDVDQTG